jgi:molecular chaperone GrpE
MNNKRPTNPDDEAGEVDGGAEDLAAADPTLQVEAPMAADGDVERITRELSAERDKHLRLAAEFDNFRKRTIRERQEAGSRAQADLVQGLLEALDDIMRFADLDPATVDSQTVVQGVNMVERKVMKTLSGHGLEVVDPAGRPFDPAFHEAVATEPAASAEEDHHVARVYQPGYLFRGQLLRPARVVVKQWLG